ncbi:transcription factor HBP-1b(c38) isoform X1 [Cucumis melo var. makuwa]|uniref:Transcription factor HBP-1b(C38) isoform X1 n=1 Tax=Cucumis melo var. makuwa TaxID=1194695 RepID=A0A5A7U827_CUCMM|nr:transcription factor HBP-1b(c38) isoform X1 [Cucumis melo var. makuwa]
MQSFENPEQGDDSGRFHTRFLPDIEELQQSAAAIATFHQDDAVDLSPSSVFGLKSTHNTAFPIHLPYGNTDVGSIGRRGYLDTGQELMRLKRVAPPHSLAVTVAASSSLGNGSFENWGESAMADNSQQTDTSTDIDNDERHQFQGAVHGALMAVDSMDQSKAKSADQKTLRRLAQNREAARKSRLRKKAYVQQLENSRQRLAQLEQELHRARQQQGIFVTSGVGDHCASMAGNGALAFDLDYARWLDEHQRLINDLRASANSQLGDDELRFLVDGVMTHYDELFRLKSVGAKADVFHILSGMWKTPAERCFMWLGGFRSSELLKIVGSHLEPLTDQQLMGICNLQQSSQQAEDALSQGIEALQQSLVETLSSASLGPASSGNVADYMGQMAIAMSKLTTLENFLHQADLLRQQTLQQMHRILTTRQAARALLVISDYISRLRALSSLWLARPKE